jgi:hypothetical protein
LSQLDATDYADARAPSDTISQKGSTMSQALQIPQHPAAAQIHTLVRELDARLHDVLEFTSQPTFDPIEATRVMDRFERAHRTLDHRFCWLLLELDEANQAAQEPGDSPAEADPPAAPPVA